MMAYLIIGILASATVLSACAILSQRPRAMLLGWLSAGLFLSIYFLVLGFELLGAVNAFFVVASTTVLHLYASLYGTRKIAEAEREVTRGDWIHALGSFLVLAAILGFGLSEVPVGSGIAPELSVSDFVIPFLRDFPELSTVLGFVLFLVIVIAAMIGRPAWVRLPVKSADFEKEGSGR